MDHFGTFKGAPVKVDTLNKMGSDYMDLRESEELLDVEGHKIDAHRVVLSARLPYFRRMFASKMVETSERNVSMEGITFVGLKEIVNFAYSGKFCVTSENVLEFLRGADYLGVSEMKEQCEDFLLSEITSKNYSALLKLAEKLQLKKLCGRVAAFMSRNFSKLCFTEKFMLVECIDALEKLLASDYLDVKDEQQVFEFVVKWTKHESCLNEANRVLLFPQLLRHVRVHQLSARYFHVVFSKCDFVLGCEEGQRRIEEIKAKMTKTKADFQSDSSLGSLLESSVDTPRSANTIVCAGWRNNSIEIFDPVQRKWRLMSQKMQIFSPNSFGLACIGEKMFVVSRMENIGGTTKEVKCLDFVSLKWSKLASLQGFRFSPALVALGENFLYAVGGLGYTSRWECENSVERYDISRNEWTKMAPMKACWGSVAAAVYDGQIYVVGGSISDKYHHGFNSIVDFCERYDPIADEWTPIASMLHKRQNCGVAVVDDHLYAIGGQCDYNYSLRHCERYSFAEDKWTEIEPLSIARCNFAVATLGHRIFAIGGENHKKETQNTVEVYDSVTGKWTLSASLNIPRHLIRISSSLFQDLRSSHGVASIKIDCTTFDEENVVNE